MEGCASGGAMHAVCADLYLSVFSWVAHFTTSSVVKSVDGACMQYVPIPTKEHLRYRVLDFQGGQNPMIVFALQIVLQDQVRFLSRPHAKHDSFFTTV